MTEDRAILSGRGLEDSPGKEPWGLRLRSSPRFITFVATFGIFTDLLVYSSIIPVIPYQLDALGYDGIGAKVSWLLLAWSGTLVLATSPVAYYSEVYCDRKVPLLVGIVALIGSQIMFMEAPTYWLMVLARFLQGASSAVIWTIGSALLCDTVPEQHIGRQFGIVSMGNTIGNLIGPPVGGTLYQRWGFRAPFIFGILVTGIDLLARLLLIERREAMMWGIDPMVVAVSDEEKDPEVPSAVTTSRRADKLPVPDTKPATQEHSNDSPVCGGEGSTNFKIREEAREGDQGEKRLQEATQSRVTSLPHIVLLKLVKSPRAAAPILLALIWGSIMAAQETVVVLHMNRVWGLDPHKAGIAFIAAVVPAIFSGAFSGWLGDRYGSARVGCAALLLSLPWFGLITIQGPLPAFLTFFSLEIFFALGLVTILMMEISSVCKSIENVGYAHVYGALTLAYGTGTAIGPIIAGQMYDHIEKGWLAISFVAMGSMSVGFVLALFTLGERPLCRWPFQTKKNTPGEQTLEEQMAPQEKAPPEGSAVTTAALA